MNTPFLPSIVFVLLWSTGFLGAKFGLPFAEPLSFLGLRFAIASAILAMAALLLRRRWPGLRSFRDQAMIGAFMHFVYLGGVFWGISLGAEAGLAALIVGLQPVATALLAMAVLGERLRGIQWAGMALGFGGVLLAVFRKLDSDPGSLWAVALLFIGLAGVAVATILQKGRSGSTDVLTGNAIQFAAASLCCYALASAVETGQIAWTPQFVGALAWLVLVLSIGVVWLLYWLIRNGAASEVGSLFFLVPPVTAVFAWVLFDERLHPLDLLGLAITAVGVLLVVRPPRRA